MKYVLPLIVCSLLLSCKPADKKSLSPEVEAGKLSVNLPGMKLNNAFPGIELLLGPGETPLAWFPSEETVLTEKERQTPKGKARDFTMTWKHPEGYELTWIISELQDIPGITVRSSFTNNSGQPLRLRDFVLLKTSQDGLVCDGNPASWWLLPAMEYGRQAGNLAQVFPSGKRLREQRVYGYDGIDTLDQRNTDGHWRFHEELVTLYNDVDRKGIAMGAVGPGVSHVSFNSRVDNGNIQLEILSQMDEILVDPAETRESEEVLILAKPYKEALDNMVSWIAETHQARLKNKPVFGWCSWYDRFENIDEEHILNVIKASNDLKVKIPMDVIQIDYGWSIAMGDWTANKKFPRGMKYIADKIKETGAVPGIWMAPVSSDVQKPRDWYQLSRRDYLFDSIQKKDFSPMEVLNPIGTYLDCTHPGVEEFICSSIGAMKEMGYRYFKFDYNYMGKHRPYNPKMTNFQAMRHLFELYRKSLGEECFMLACGAPMRPVVGLADASRMSWDALARWKSYPLADDGLPTLCTDIFDGIYNTAMSSGLNMGLFINDPDVTYLLPRAEDHIWQGPEGSFDPEQHGLKWSGLKTFHSYVGLMGGMTMISEPLYKPEYQQKNSIRMFEILHPPAPEKAWSMNGDIDPWGRQFGFVAEKQWGTSASVVLWNKEDVPADLSLDTYTLKTLGEKFHIWSFWDEKYLGISDGTFLAEDVEANGCMLLKLTRVTNPAKIPVVVGSNLHISMGSAELDAVITNDDETVIKLTNAGARDGRIYLYCPKPLKVQKSSGCSAFIMPQSENISMVVITDRSVNEPNTIHLSVDKSVADHDELLKNGEQKEKYLKSGFDADQMQVR